MTIQTIFQVAKNNVIVRNLFYWLVTFFVFIGLAQSGEDDSFWEISKGIFGILIYMAIPIYINSLVLFQFFRKKEYLKYALLLIGMVAIWALFAKYISDNYDYFMKGSYRVHFGNTLFFLFVATLLILTRDYFAKQAQQKTNELNHLKAQLNPHFLFNTLNNLYGLAVLKSDKLPDLMLKLSNLLRYSLYETKDAFVDLVKEVQYIQDYVDLERIRLDEEAEIRLEVKGDFSDRKIAPMLLLTFVENAFKHHGRTFSQTAFVNILVEMKGNTLILDIENSKDIAQIQQVATVSGGFGLKATKKRLELIYPKNHQLETSSSEEKYWIRLELTSL